jgi:2-methylisocitrate lyase-like PEP mutase family enzyme
VAEKLAIAKGERRNPDLLIIARTDSYGLEGLDGALRRGERYLKAGADGIFIPAVARPEEIERAGNAFRGTYQMIVMSEGGKTPWLSPAELHGMGYSQVAYPSFLMLRTILAIARGLVELKAIVAGKGGKVWSDVDEARAVFQRAVRQREWEAIERRRNQP